MPKSFAPTIDVDALFHEKLESSGLTGDDARLLRYTAIDADTSRSLGHWPVPALRIPYFDPFTGEPMRHHPKWPEFYRVRWLVEPATIDPKNKPAKYLQPRDSGVCAYYPTIGAFEWKDVLTDYEMPVTITEGELKAAAACRAGFPTIGLGGVFNFMSRNYGDLMVSSLLDGIIWPRRVVRICFDSDLATKPGVCQALWQLAERFKDLGAIPRMIVLPSPNGTKIGLDDYLLDHTAQDLEDLFKNQGKHLTTIRALFDINESHSWVSDIGSVVRHKTGDVVKPGPEFTYAFTSTVEKAELRPNGSVDYTTVSAGRPWLEWPLRATVESVTYDPAQPALSRFVDPATGDLMFNTWPGWGTNKKLVPIKGDVAPFLDMMRYLFTGAPPEAMIWMIKWLGYPIKHPGAKLRTAAIIHGVGERTGKSSIGYTMKEIYGPGFIEISQEDFHSAFNTWQVRRQLVMCDDMTGVDKHQNVDSLKKRISQKEVYVNEKNKPNYTLPDKSNFFFTSNRPSAIAVAEQDSRFFVHRVEVDPRPREWWDGYYHWLRDMGGAAAIFHYFLTDVDYADFNPYGDAFVTTAKENMKEASRSGLEQFVHDLVRVGPEAVLTMDGVIPPDVANRDLYTSEEIALFYEARYPNDRPHYRTVARHLESLGCFKVNNGNMVSVAGRNRVRYWCIRNPKQWKDATHDDISSHVLKPTPAPQSKRKKK